MKQQGDWATEMNAIFLPDKFGPTLPLPKLTTLKLGVGEGWPLHKSNLKGQGNEDETGSRLGN